MTQALRCSGDPGEEKGAAHALLFPPFRLDPINEQLWLGDRCVALPPLAFQVLRYLVERPQRLVSKRELSTVLCANAGVKGLLETQIKELRQRLGDTVWAPRFIETVHRRGYRFIADVHWQGERSPMLAPRIGIRAVVPACAPAFVGRSAELSRLEALWASARQGQRRLAFVTGEAGIGKTTLVSRLAEATEAREHAWFAWGQCVEQHGAGEAYLPLLEAFARLCGNADAVPVADVLRREAPTWWSQLSESLGAAGARAPEEGFGAVPPERMLRELGEALVRLTQQRPLLIILEDLHWADPSTLGLISYLAQCSDPARLFIVGTYRSRDVRSSDHPLWTLLPRLESRGHGEELTLKHLDEREVQTYLAARFPAADFPAALAHELCGLTAGNPLFMSRVVDVLSRRGMIRRQAQRFRFTGAMSSIQAVVPARLVLLIAGETERSSPFERAVLDAAAVAGFEFSVAALAAALECDMVELEELCERWMREERFFKRANDARSGVGPRCEFVHALYRQVLYQRLAPTRRMQLHRRFGAHEEASHASAPQNAAGLLALHFRLGGDPERALRYGLMAGEHALRRSACREAIGHLSAAREMLDELDDAEERGGRELDRLVTRARQLLEDLGAALEPLQPDPAGA